MYVSNKMFLWNCPKVCQSEHDSRRSIVSKENILSNKQMLSRRPAGQTHSATEAKDNEERGGDDEAARPSASQSRAANRSSQAEKKEHAINSDTLLESLSLYSERFCSNCILICNYTFSLMYVPGTLFPSLSYWSGSVRRRRHCLIPSHTAWSAEYCKEGGGRNECTSLLLFF